jgi:predicted SPOUT superfamily RNA methylase MTH1
VKTAKPSRWQILKMALVFLIKKVMWVEKFKGIYHAKIFLIIKINAKIPKFLLKTYVPLENTPTSAEPP